MNGYGIKILQWGYPLVLWIMVAFFTFLACKNVVATASVQTRPAPSFELPAGTVIVAAHSRDAGFPSYSE